MTGEKARHPDRALEPFLKLVVRDSVNLAVLITVDGHPSKPERV